MSEPHYIRRKIKAASERGRKMAAARWKRDREWRDKMARLTAEMMPSKILKRVIVIENESVVREAVRWSFDSGREWRRKLRTVIYGK